MLCQYRKIGISNANDLHKKLDLILIAVINKGIGTN